MRETLTWTGRHSLGQKNTHFGRKSFILRGRYSLGQEDTWADIYSLEQKDTHLAEIYSSGQKSVTWRGRCAFGQEDTWPDIYSLGEEVPTWAGMILTWAGRCRTRWGRRRRRRDCRPRRRLPCWEKSAGWPWTERPWTGRGSRSSPPARSLRSAGEDSTIQ